MKTNHTSFRILKQKKSIDLNILRWAEFLIKFQIYTTYIYFFILRPKYDLFLFFKYFSIYSCKQLPGRHTLY